jgi:CO/xanthine dehydrogenase Mo-binding subunit
MTEGVERESPRRVDGRAKAAGRTRYLDDYGGPDAPELHGALVCSPCSRGRIVSVALPEGFDLSGFTVVSARDIPGTNLVPEPVSDQPFLADGEVLHAGQPILGVAHASREVALRFARGVRVICEQWPAVVDPDEAFARPDTAFGKRLRIEHRAQSSAPDAPAAGRLLRTSGVYRTPHQEQAYLEPQAAQASYCRATRTALVMASLQCPYYVKEAVQAILGAEASDVVVRTPEGVGGGFGGKEDFPNVLAGIAALLSFRSGKSVRIVLDRGQDVSITTKRHPARVRIESEADWKGRLRRLRVDYRLDAGAYQTLSPVVLSRGVLHAAGGYACPEVEVTGTLHRTNTPPNGAFRGFGAPQALFAMESHIDDLAREAGLDPLEIRRANVLRDGDEMPTGQIVRGTGLADCLERVAALSGFVEKRVEYDRHNAASRGVPGGELHGIGLALGCHGGGFTGNGERRLDSEVKVTVLPTAEVIVDTAAVDMGQGAYTTLAQIAARALGHPLALVRAPPPDTSRAPNSGPTVASRTIYIVGGILAELGPRILSELGTGDLAAFVAGHPDRFPREWRARYRPPEGAGFDEERYLGTAYGDYSWVACVSEIRYDPATWRILPWRSWSVLDVGRVVNTQVALGQAEGGVVQAWGYALTEVCYRKGLGRVRGFTDYTLPLSLDVPEIAVEFVHTEDPVSKGLGEVPMDCPAASIRNALLHATGLRVDSLPLTPETLLEQTLRADAEARGARVRA